MFPTLHILPLWLIYFATENLCLFISLTCISRLHPHPCYLIVKFTHPGFVSLLEVQPCEGRRLICPVCGLAPASRTQPASRSPVSVWTLAPEGSCGACCEPRLSQRRAHFFFFLSEECFIYLFIFIYIYIYFFYWSLVDFFFFWLCFLVCGILVPQPGIEPVPLQWKCGVSTTGPPGKSLK